MKTIGGFFRGQLKDVFCISKFRMILKKSLLLLKGYIYVINIYVFKKQHRLN